VNARRARASIAAVTNPAAPGLAGTPSEVPERVVRAVGRIAEALFHDGASSPSADRIAWLEDDVRDFLGRATGRARLMFRLCVFVVVWVGPVWALSLPPLTWMKPERRVAVLERMESSLLAFAFLAVKALLCMMFYEHPDSAREVGFDGHAASIAVTPASLVRSKR
jgi:hypothetical protein